MSSKAKQRWNEKNYTQVKVSVRHSVASVFKSICAEKGESQASVLAKAMLDYADEPLQQDMRADKKPSDSTKYGTRRKRRKAVSDILTVLGEILEAEEAYKDGIPENFANRIEVAEECIEMLSEAINSLQDAYQM